MLTSQPSAGLPLQLAKPPLQPATAQRPPLQKLAALEREQRAPQPPQFDTSPERVTSQPSAPLPLQSPKPALHATTVHRPPAQTPVPLVGEQRTPQPPQFDPSLTIETSQPFAGLPSQFAKPALQLSIAHRPPAQLAVAFEREHHEPQPPQCMGLVSVETSQPLM